MAISSSPSSSPDSRKVSNRRRVRDLIQQMILSGQRQAGDRLVQQDLARQFGVSQGVVREALIDLQFSGLVRSVERLGVFVNDIGLDQVLQAGEIREVLDGLAARLCCQQAARADIGRLTETNEQMYRFGREGQVKQRGILDRSLHNLIIEVSNNEVLQRLTEGYRILGLAVQARRDVHVVYEEHRKIIEAIEQNRPEEAEYHARDHVRASREALQEAVQDGRFQPDWVVGASDSGEPRTGMDTRNVILFAENGDSTLRP